MGEVVNSPRGRRWPEKWLTLEASLSLRPSPEREDLDAARSKKEIYPGSRDGREIVLACAKEDK